MVWKYLFWTILNPGELFTIFVTKFKCHNVHSSITCLLIQLWNIYSCNYICWKCYGSKISQISKVIYNWIVCFARRIFNYMSDTNYWFLITNYLIFDFRCGNGRTLHKIFTCFINLNCGWWCLSHSIWYCKGYRKRALCLLIYDVLLYCIWITSSLHNDLCIRLWISRSLVGNDSCSFYIFFLINIYYVEKWLA